MTKASTLANLRNAGTVTSTEIVTAIDHFVRDPAAPPYRSASGHTLDIAEILAVERIVDARVSRSAAERRAFRSKVTAAIMAAHPVSP